MTGKAPQGVTLVELLVAIGVGSLVFMASVSVYLVVTSSLGRQRSSAHDTAYATLDQLRHDLAACAQAPSSNTPVFSVECQLQETNMPGVSSLVFSQGRLPSPDDDFSRLEVIRVRYGVISPASLQEAGGRLIKETMTLWGADAFAPAVTSVMMEGVSAFEVQALAEAGWTNAWSSSARSLYPRAVRIRLDWRTSVTTETATVDVFVPAGNSITGARVSRP